MSEFVHGDNLSHKEAEYMNDRKKSGLLKEIRKQYNKWKKANMALVGPFAKPSESDHVRLLNEYKDFIDCQKYVEAFDSRGALFSSVLEEFILYLFKDMTLSLSPNALIGKAKAYKDTFFKADSFSEMMEKPNVHIEKKDHDFVIGINIEAKFKSVGSENEQTETLEVPVVAIECKTYLDKTMLEAVDTAATQLLKMNPNSIYIVVAERLKLSEDVNLKKYKINQYYILRKQINTDRKDRFKPDYDFKPIYTDVVEHLFNMVRIHLTSEWHSSKEEGLARGYLL